MGRAEWDLAGFTADLSQLGKRVQGGTIAVPGRVELSESRDALLYRWENTRYVTPSRKMFDSFISLADDTPLAIQKFANKWGILALGEYGRPCVRKGPIEREEPISAWRHFSRRAVAIVNIAASLRLGKVGQLDDWKALRDGEQFTGDFSQELLRFHPSALYITFNKEWPFSANGFGTPAFSRTIEQEQMFLFAEINRWLILTRVGFFVAPAKGKWQGGWELEISYNQCLLAAVALQLCMVLAEVDALFKCSGCGYPYRRKTKSPKPGQANFCPTCGREKALQQADRRRREKISRARELFSSGMTISNIADELDSSEETIDRWIQKGKQNGKKTR